MNAIAAKRPPQDQGLILIMCGIALIVLAVLAMTGCRRMSWHVWGMPITLTTRCENVIGSDVRKCISDGKTYVCVAHFDDSYDDCTQVTAPEKP